MQGNFKYPRINKIHQILEKITRFDQKVEILCVLLSHELFSPKIYYISIYTFFILFIQDKFKNPKIIIIQQVHQKMHTKQFFILYKLFSICNSFEFKATQET